MDLTTQTVPGDGYVTLRVSGELDMHTAATLREAALEALRQHGTTMWLDLRDVSFMDSTGLEVLLATRRRTELEGGSLTLVGPNACRLRVLEVTGLDKVFTIAADESGAPCLSHSGQREDLAAVLVTRIVCSNCAVRLPVLGHDGPAVVPHVPVVRCRA